MNNATSPSFCSEFFIQLDVKYLFFCNEVISIEILITPDEFSKIYSTL